MEFTIERDVFQKALQKVQGVAVKKSTLAILQNVLIESEDGRVTLTATDLDIGIRSSYPADVSVGGRTTISAKVLFDIVKELPRERVTFTTSENDWSRISCGRSVFNIVGLSAEEFPKFPEISDELLMPVSCTVLSGLIDRTSYAISTDDTKHNLCGLFAKTTEDRQLTLAATDGHRLAISRFPVNPNVSGSPLENGIILPRKGVAELKRFLEIGDEDQVLFGITSNKAVARKGESVLVMQLVDGEFPDCDRVIPIGNDKKIEVSTESLSRSISRMSILSSEKFKGVLFDISDNKISISSSNPEMGDASEEIEVVYSGDPFSVRFNSKYLLDVLNIAAKNVIISFKDEVSPALILPDTGDSFLAVVMPMRI